MFSQAFASTLPLEGSEIAARWDSLYSFLLWLSIIMFVGVVGAMMYFICAYRHKPGVKTKYLTGSHLLEAIWVFIPTVILLVLFAWGYSVYHGMTQGPSDAYEVRVIGKQWLWTFQYDDGRTTYGELYVPLNRPVRLVMTSEDVLHGFFIPNFRIKQDVVPGMYTSIWFTATVPGKHQVFCTEYCGAGHSGMLAKVIVLDDPQWDAWRHHQKLGSLPEAGQTLASAEVPLNSELNSGESSKSKENKSGNSAGNAVVSQVSLAEQGRTVYESKGCTACHSIDGTKKIGPSHKGLYGSKVELADGRTVVADDNYIRGHIENPRGTLVKGYSPVMPTFKGLISETEMNALIAYLKSLK